MTSRKQVRDGVSVLRYLTSSCCQGRRRDTEMWRQGTGRQLMSVWNSGTESCPHHQLYRDRLTMSFTARSPTVLVDDRSDDVCYHHHHHHHHDFCEWQQQQQQQVSSTDGLQGCNTSISTLSARQPPLECRRHRSRHRMT